MCAMLTLMKFDRGTKFGVAGYFYLARGVYPAGCGPAGILLQNPSYPIMA